MSKKVSCTCITSSTCVGSFTSIHQSTVMKKMMYYNMRVRMAQRTLAEMRLSLTARQTTMQEIPEESVQKLSHSIKNVREISEAFFFSSKRCCPCEAC